MEDDNKPVEEVTPKPGDQPAPDPVPPPVEKKPDDELRGMVESLQEQVSGLTAAVEGLVNDGDPEMDKGPVHRPWTHWKPRKA